MTAASYSKRRRAEEGACLAGGGACGRGLRARAPSSPLLPSPFEPPRNATSPRMRRATGGGGCFRAPGAGAAAEEEAVVAEAGVFGAPARGARPFGGGGGRVFFG